MVYLADLIETTALLKDRDAEAFKGHKKLKNGPSAYRQGRRRTLGQGTLLDGPYENVHGHQTSIATPILALLLEPGTRRGEVRRKGLVQGDLHPDDGHTHLRLGACAPHHAPTLEVGNLGLVLGALAWHVAHDPVDGLVVGGERQCQDARLVG